MGKKTTPYGRKLARLRAAAHNGNALVLTDHGASLRALSRCRSFDQAPALDFMDNYSGHATDAIVMINDALADLLAHRVAPEDSRPFDLLAHAVDVGHIRALQIDHSQTNPAHATFLAAKAVLQSLRTHHAAYNRWALTGPDRDTIAQAVDHYEAILTASSPQQMAVAVDIRKAALRKGRVWAPGGKSE